MMIDGKAVKSVKINGQLWWRKSTGGSDTEFRCYIDPVSTFIYDKYTHSLYPINNNDSTLIFVSNKPLYEISINDEEGNGHI